MSCRDELPRRFKWVIIRTAYGTCVARRGMLGFFWVTRGGFREVIIQGDKWRYLSEEEKDLMAARKTK